VEKTAVTFEANAEFVYRVIERAEKMGLSLVGIYHSHPNTAAYISTRDMEFMSLWPSVAWLIISLTESGIREVKAYISKKGKVKELRIKIH
jgi:proteasome lid subunit RPN8/RPN11